MYVLCYIINIPYNYTQRDVCALSCSDHTLTYYYYSHSLIRFGILYDIISKQDNSCCKLNSS